MKKRITLLLIAIFATIQFSQSREVLSPIVGSSNAGSHTITKVEILEDATKLHMESKVSKSNWFLFAADTYIVADNDKSYKVVEAEGLTIGEKRFGDESGTTSYTLIFEAIPTETKILDLDERVSNGFKISDVYVGTEPISLPVEESLMGDWFSTDGSSRFLLGMNREVVLYRNDIWSYADSPIAPKKGTIEIENRKDPEQRVTLYYKKSKGGELLIGESRKELQTLSKERIFNNDYTIPSTIDEEWSIDSFFVGGKATIQGLFGDYSHKTYDKRAMCYIRSYIASEDDKMKMIEIAPDGTFEVELDLPHPMEVGVMLGGQFIYIFATPNQTLTLSYPMNKVSWKKYQKKNNEIRYMGDEGMFNTQIARYSASMPIYDRQEFYKELDIEPYKEHIDQRWESSVAYLESYIDSTKLIPNVARFLTNRTLLSMGQNLSLYKSQRAYHTKTDYKDFKIPYSFYERYKDLPLDDLRIVANSDNYFFINGLQFLGFSEWASFDAFDSYLAVRGFEMTSQDAESRAYYPHFIVSAFGKFCEEELGVESSFGTDVAVSYFVKDSYLDEMLINESSAPLDELVESIGSPVVKRLIRERAEGRRAEIMDMIIEERVKRAVAKATSGAAVAEVAAPAKVAPKAKEGEASNAAKIIAKLLEPLRGDIVMLDFWAMWCAPCKSGIVESYKYKEKMEGYKMSFAYVTTEEYSPTKTREAFFEENKVEGLSLVVSKDDWMEITAEYNITGIPRYMLIDKEGNVIKDRFSIGEYGYGYDELKAMAGVR